MAKKRRSSQFKDTSQVIDIDEARRKRQEKRKQQRPQQTEMPVPKRAVRASIKAGRRKKNLTYAVIIVCIIAAIGASVLNIVSLKSEYNKAKETNQQLTEQKKQLEQDIKDSGADEFIEEEAREQLRMVNPGESIYIVPNQENISTENTEGEQE